MKKIYIALLCVLTSFAFSAQSSSNQLAKKHEVILEKIRPNLEAQPKGVVLWDIILLEVLIMLTQHQ